MEQEMYAKQQADPKQIFAQRLKEEREVRSWSQDDLAAVAGVSRQSITFYEKGARVPDILTARKIAQSLSVTTDYLLGLSDNRIVETNAIGQQLGLKDELIALLTDAHAVNTPDSIRKDMAENTKENGTVDIIGYFQARSPHGRFTKSTANRYLRSVNQVCTDPELMGYLYDYITDAMPEEVEVLLKNTEQWQKLRQNDPAFCRAISMHHIQKRLSELAEEYAHSTSTANLKRRTEDILDRLDGMQAVLQSLSNAEEATETKGE